jgi:hypothetical protein
VICDQISGFWTQPNGEALEPCVLGSQKCHSDEDCDDDATFCDGGKCKLKRCHAFEAVNGELKLGRGQEASAVLGSVGVFECNRGFVYQSSIFGIKELVEVVCVPAADGHTPIWVLANTDEKLDDCRPGCRLHELCPSNTTCPYYGDNPWTCQPHGQCPDLKPFDEKITVEPQGNNILKLSCPEGKTLLLNSIMFVHITFSLSTRNNHISF